jgi:hypothetical protein
MAVELLSRGEFIPRQLTILIMDKKLITKEFFYEIDKHIQKHELGERNQLTDWFIANQLTKDKHTIAFIKSWRKSSSVIQRRNSGIIRQDYDGLETQVTQTQKTY